MDVNLLAVGWARPVPFQVANVQGPGVDELSSATAWGSPWATAADDAPGASATADAAATAAATAIAITLFMAIFTQFGW